MGSCSHAGDIDDEQKKSPTKLVGQRTVSNQKCESRTVRSDPQHVSDSLVQVRVLLATQTNEVHISPSVVQGRDRKASNVARDDRGEHKSLRFQFLERGKNESGGEEQIPVATTDSTVFHEPKASNFSPAESRDGLHGK